MSNTALKVLQRQEDGRLQLAIHALALLTAAAEPMIAGALSHAMGIAYSLLNDDQPQELKEDEVPNTAVIIECFMGLAETHPLTGIVTLRAADIEQRIRKHWDDFFGHGSKVQNTELCLAYLSLDAFSNGACDQIDALGRRLEHYPF